ncbi:VirB8/TrbF family protein [Saccharopolyspora sp. NFXS83]|uniref:VirB8/TrbF family protein n=1 Tax=Saccharopolyspora sp. NFXS83 TaxID=2993560 RepID=UPI00224A8E2B|nr:VirB8/TrbF family protein [Saccharopolyspora sp. NFXS83]MCX2730481.1 VirB8/TrbF family protein [Saccharopolyspora sp. NFXS83]
MTSDRAESDRDAGTTSTRLPEADGPGTSAEGAEDSSTAGGEPAVAEDPPGTAGGASESAVEGDAGGQARLRALRRPPVLAAALAILLLLGGLTYTGVQLREAAVRDTARAEALAAGERYALALTTYDHQNLRDDFGSVSENASPEFARQYKEVSDGLTQLIQQYQATSKGEVRGAGAVRAEPDRAVLVLFVDQTITNTNSPEPRVDRTRMQLTLVHPDGKWLIDDVKLV